jgi:hypothetical protein
VVHHLTLGSSKLDKATKEDFAARIVEQLEDYLKHDRHLAAPGEEGLEGKPRPLPKAPRFWIVELWTENRETFKHFVKHILLFSMLLGSLEALHRLMARSTLPAEELHTLNELHFYMWAIVSVIFASSFIVKVLKSEFWGE